MNTVIRNMALAALCLIVADGCRYDPAPPLVASSDARPLQDSARTPEAAPSDIVTRNEPPGPDAAPSLPGTSADATASDIAPVAPVAPDAATACAPNQTMACYVGPPGTRGVGLCRDGSRSCQADGNWGSCAGQRTPGAEQCNGSDEDCDGVIDDGCPVDGALLDTDGARASSPSFGSLFLDQNRSFAHRCPVGQVVVAFTGNYGYAIDSLGVVCANLRVREDRGAMPFRYPLSVEQGQSFEPIGGTGGGVNNATRCPPGFVVSGVGAWPSKPSTVCTLNYCAGVSAPDCPANFGLEILCSRYQIEGAPGSFRLVQVDEPPFRTAARMEIDLSGIGFPNSKADHACPAGQVVVDTSGTVGPWPYDCARTAVNALRVACTQPTVRMR